jgi:hypothetical protein
MATSDLAKHLPEKVTGWSAASYLSPPRRGCENVTQREDGEGWVYGRSGE